MRRNVFIVIAGAVLSAIVGAMACSGPFVWASIENPEHWGVDLSLIIFMLGVGATIGGACSVVLAVVGGSVGKVVSSENGEGVGVILGVLAGAIIGGLVAFSLAIIGMGIAA